MLISHARSKVTFREFNYIVYCLLRLSQLVSTIYNRKVMSLNYHLSDKKNIQTFQNSTMYLTFTLLIILFTFFNTIIRQLQFYLHYFIYLDEIIVSHGEDRYEDDSVRNFANKEDDSIFENFVYACK